MWSDCVCGAWICNRYTYSQTPRQHRPIPFGIFSSSSPNKQRGNILNQTIFSSFVVPGQVQRVGGRVSPSSFVIFTRRILWRSTWCWFYTLIMTFLLKSVFSFLSLPRNKRTSIFTPKGSPPCCCVNIRWGETDPTAHTEIYPLDKTTDRKNLKEPPGPIFIAGGRNGGTYTTTTTTNTFFRFFFGIYLCIKTFVECRVE